MKTLKKIGHYYDKAEEVCLVAILAICVVIIFLQVIMRFVFNNSLSWSEEICKYLFIWLIWLGTSIAAKVKGHLCIEVISGKARGTFKYALDILVKMIWLALCVFLLVNGADLVMSMIARNKTASSVPWLKVWVVYLAIPVSQGILSIRIILEILEDARRLIHHDCGTEKAGEGER